MLSTFESKLRRSVISSDSILCVGLDPDPEKMPVEDIFSFCKGIVDGTASHVCAYKPNLAFFEASGLNGSSVLKDVVDYIHVTYPDKIVIGDGKRGDIGSSSSKYAYSIFELLGFDATTVNAYGGYDSIRPFIEYRDKGIFVWCKSSNPDGYQFQGGGPELESKTNVYEKMAEMSLEWNSHGNVGLVVGATFPCELAKVRSLAPGIPILVPGVGSQKGDLASSLESGAEKHFPNIFINSSRSINYASSDQESYSTAAGKVAAVLKEDINEILRQIPDPKR
jgi:orotidine-5'-phosphate decarboxylase